MAKILSVMAALEAGLSMKKFLQEHSWSIEASRVRGRAKQGSNRAKYRGQALLGAATVIAR
jgi:hypothetical protein